MRAVECLVVCGLPAQPVTVDGVAGFVGAGESYRPEVLQSYPPTTGLGDLLPGGGDDDSPRDDGEMGQRWPPHLAACAMPRGVDVHVASNPPPDAVTPASYPIVLTDAHGARLLLRVSLHPRAGAHEDARDRGRVAAERVRAAVRGARLPRAHPRRH